MRRPRNVRAAAWLLGVGLIVSVASGVTYAAFSRTTTNSGNSLAAAPDFVPPLATSSIIAKTSGYFAGSIRQGGAYYVYANATDTGNPASGVATVRADVSNVSPGQTAVPLVTGAYSVNGVAYGYRSASVTANSPLAAGAYSYSLTLTDNAANSQTQGGFSVTVDNTAPAGVDIQTANGGATVGKAETADTVTFTFSETMEPDSILTGWTGPPTTVTVRLINGGGGNDTMQIWNSANTAQLPFGAVNLGRTDYVNASRNFTNSTMVQAGPVIAVTLGTPSGATPTAGGTGTMAWTPSAAATDAAGNACSAAVATESGIPDAEF